ncbi:hypothetical protein DO97_13430 [Neosynechococcus sphagnicola sy1]|uniref:PDGLE domain-containing protein n=1 Tax=Neosynechococcus sphagnicola sy1 TaxID=1497020 RepID=A0A098TMF6_9CYAN|nr:PDGLE domain-containing protein [Neosynechococcus sphagnicola]KGF72023.1 hypothetical protein DO97_13430 [Neosynechococcus sphagnicola sy1]
MRRHRLGLSNRNLVMVGLGTALGIAVLLSPFASSNPDGLDRVSQDHGFDRKALATTPAQQLPFHRIFDQYTLRGVPAGVATPLAGLIGTLLTFGLAWGIGKLAVRGTQNPDIASPSSSEPPPQ